MDTHNPQDFLGVSVLSLTEPGTDNLNPLPPCGVCSSWLEKIYEVNSEFRLITFSDATLARVHITTLNSLGTALGHIGQHALSESHSDYNVPISHATSLVVNCSKTTAWTDKKDTNWGRFDGTLAPATPKQPSDDAKAKKKMAFVSSPPPYHPPTPPPGTPAPTHGPPVVTTLQPGSPAGRSGGHAAAGGGKRQSGDEHEEEGGDATPPPPPLPAPARKGPPPGSPRVRAAKLFGGGKLGGSGSGKEAAGGSGSFTV